MKALVGVTVPLYMYMIQFDLERRWLFGPFFMLLQLVRFII